MMRNNLAAINKFTYGSLHFRLIEEKDAAFIFDLLNTEGWIKNIGNRNIHNQEDAIKYIQKINSSDNICYFLVSTHPGAKKLGLVTIIKRENYDLPDIGFAFLPAAQGKGFAFQAAIGLLSALKKINFSPSYIAITLPGNHKSIMLLKKLGFEYEREQVDNNELLHVYRKK